MSRSAREAARERQRRMVARKKALAEGMERRTGRALPAVYYRIALDFPVGATEMLAFEPRSHEDQAAPGQGTAATGDQTAAPGTAAK